MTPRKSTKSKSISPHHIETVLANLDVAWEARSIPLDSIVREDSNPWDQPRLEGEDQERIERITAAVVGGEVMPGLVVVMRPVSARRTAPVLLDGRHRLPGMIAAGVESAMCYVVEGDDSLLERIAIRCNVGGGDGFTPDDLRSHSYRYTARGWSAAEVAAELGVKADTVTRWTRVAAAKQKAVDLGCDEGAVSRIAGKDGVLVEALNIHDDEVFLLVIKHLLDKPCHVISTERTKELAIESNANNFASTRRANAKVTIDSLNGKVRVPAAAAETERNLKTACTIIIDRLPHGRTLAESVQPKSYPEIYARMEIAAAKLLAGVDAMKAHHGEMLGKAS